jgi:inner membrane protein
LEGVTTVIYYTHALLGVATYMVINKKEMNPAAKKALFVTAVVGSVIPDIDVIVKYTEIGQLNYQMWHRGITHSLIFIPIWSFLISLLTQWIFKIKDRRILRIAMITVTTHIFTDCLNPWGTGLFEPFFNKRVSFGVISYADQIMPLVIVVGLILSLLWRQLPANQIFRGVWIMVGLHVLIQTAMSGWLFTTYNSNSHQVLIVADASPWQFRIVTQTNETFHLYNGRPWSMQHQETIESLPITDRILENNPKAQILRTWAPALVLQDTGSQYRLFDPRFYVNGDSFLSVAINKDKD